MKPTSANIDYMKKLIYMPAASLLILMAGCASSGKPADSGVDSMVDTGNVNDTATHDTVAPINNIPFEVKKFEKKKGDDELKLEYPIGGNPGVVEAVRTWINEELGGKFRGNLDNADGFFHVYASTLGDDPDLAEYGGFTIDDFELEFVDDYVVTYEHTSYLYEGGAHGIGGKYGSSFRQSDGKMFGKKCFTSYKPLHKLFVEGLKQYFKVKTDAQLLDCLNQGTKLANIPAPALEPWITEDGVVFSYTNYEIAPYSAGSPTFTLPFDKIEQYLTEEGKTFFK